jgi:hypothetical protein
MNGEKEQLEKIVGEGNVCDAPETLETYLYDQSFALPIKPQGIIKPKDAREVQEIVKWANQTGTPLIPVSSGPPHFHGDTVPSTTGAIIIDLSGMNRIIRIDSRNRMTIVEPGVTYSQLQPELAKEGLRLSMPLLPRENKSVITSLLEREPRLIPKYQWAIPDPLRCLEVVWGDGVKVTTGDAGSQGSLEEEWEKKYAQITPAGPGQIGFYWLVSAAQGSMGIVTWASLKCELAPKIHKLFFVPSHNLHELTDFMYRVLRFRFGDELLILNGFSIASILGDSIEQIEELTEQLPSWVALVGIAGRETLPEERVDFQEKDIRDIAQQFNLQLAPAIPGVNNSEMLEAITYPSKKTCWKLIYKGGCQDIIFLTTLDRTPEFTRTMYSAAELYGYPASKIGIYIQPVHQGTSCHCEFVLPFDRNNPKEVTGMRILFTKASEELLKQGAFFSRPYGIWANLAFNRDAQTTIILKKIKGIFDPNNVMNPGKLCF